MDNIPPSVLSLFPTDAAPTEEPVEDHFHNPFPASDAPDDSLFFLFPSSAPPPDVTPIDDHTHFAAHLAKKEPVFDTFLSSVTTSAGLEAHPENIPLKRKREPVIAEHDSKHFTPGDHNPLYAAAKRARHVINSSPSLAFAPLAPPPLNLPAFPYPSTAPPMSAPPAPTKLPTAPEPKARRPAQRRKRSPGSASGSGSGSGSDDGLPSGSHRSMRAMKVLARSHAPEVALRPSELEAISAMHESDADLALSRNLYSEVTRFKGVLARFGYRMTALTLDPVTEPDANPAAEPFDFVLKRKVRPVIPSNRTPVPQAPAPDGSPVSGCGSPARSPRTDADSTAGGHTCTVCAKSVSDRETLTRHFRHAHQELKPYSCPRCKGSYSSEGTLWHHIRNVHSETPRKFRCSQCDASYDSFGAKTRHEHATHNTDTPEFACTFAGCNRAFNFPAHLESHALHDHPGFKPFGCTECSKRFNSANGLIRHKREVHRRNRAYSCSCGTTFAKKDHLKRHLLQRHSMSYERATEEMRKQPSPGLVHFMPPAAPAAAEAV